MLAQGVRWFDDWFAIETIAPGIHAIGEPRYHWFNWSYLIEGKDCALLFDTGPGIRSIAPVVDSLMAKPLTVLPSHMHFDHTGNLHQFPRIAMADLPMLRIAMADLPMLRTCESDGVFHASEDLFIGHDQGLVWKPVRISEWWAIGKRIDLGGRHLDLLHTPGHSPDSVSLFDRDAKILFAADFVYPGPLYAQVPGANLADYLKTAEALLSLINDQTQIFCAHGAPDNNGKHCAPELNSKDVSDLRSSLIALKDSGKTPSETVINSRMTLLASEAAFGCWQAT